MFRAKMIGTLDQITGYDLHGRITRAGPNLCRFMPVSLKVETATAKGAGTGATGEVTTREARILIAPETVPRLGDLFSFQGTSYEIVAVHPRFAVNTRLDHYECWLELRA